MSSSKMRTAKIATAVVVGLAVGSVAGYLLRGTPSPLVTSLPLPVEVRANLSQYQFVNPLLVIATSKDLYTDQYKALINSLDTYIQAITASGMATNTSIYFRDMNTGHWTGIGENDLYRPSSMLKVLTLMATAQLAENGVLSLSDNTLQYVPGNTNGQYYRPNDSMVAGTYSVQNLAEAMTLYSDNSANAALLSNPAINTEFTALYKIFRLPAATSSIEDFMSPRSYSVVWRALYNGTLLSDSTSEQVLQLLSHSTFKDGLVAGVPAGITVAHKFGEYTLQTPAGFIVNRELHDCGIIYYPSHPYMLCVMTRGSDFPSLAQTIAGVSKIAYNFVASSTPAGN